MMPDCPDCGRTLASEGRGKAACHNCNLAYEIGQCEGCGDRYAEQDMTTEDVPGATLWWCPDCATTRRATR